MLVEDIIFCSTFVFVSILKCKTFSHSSKKTPPKPKGSPLKQKNVAEEEHDSPIKTKKRSSRCIIESDDDEESTENKEVVGSPCKDDLDENKSVQESQGSDSPAQLKTPKKEVNFIFLFTIYEYFELFSLYKNKI